MSSDKDTAEKPKKKKKGGMLVKGVGALALCGAGAGGAYAYFLSTAEPHAEKREKDVPKLILKGEEDPYAVKAEGEEEGAGEEVLGEGGSKYRTSYYTFSDDFTSNLKNSVGLIQVSIAASTHRDGRVLMWLKKHELAVRSRVLIVLADTPEEEVLSPEGKERLRKRIAVAINDVLTEAEGFGGIDQVHFRGLLVQ
ncbi:MAG: flagellar basal body-associated protein FliL [Sphingomonadales bacterium 32-68-7]|nr:MAG: flagellar basal body-associated protein FliL [Sphingomonadales bacterium 12-68-11]OYX10174.1 MAG: flagellar basal body-associated protein FliL [Sphingomonadales bacterium 32-68-7]